MVKDELKRIILENQERMPFRLFARRIETLRTTRQIHAIIGPRRVGKTFFLYQIINELLENDVAKEAILFVNFEDERLAGLSAERLGVVLEAYYELFPERARKEVHIFLDEVQVVPGWERFVARLFEEKRYRLTVTGSSSKLLSREIATSLRGRSVATHIYPLSFAEFAAYRGLRVSEQTAFSRDRFRAVKLLESYLAWGGFFEVQDASDDAERRRIVTTYLDLVVYKDLVERYSVKNLAAMKALIRYFVTNATRKASLTKLARTLGAGPVSKNTILQYTSFLEDANVLYACAKFSYKLRQGNTLSKFYLADPSFKTVAGANFSADRGLFFENAVYMELRRRGFEVFFFEEKAECDFITKRGTRVTGAYQVCVDPEQAGERETKGFLEALEAFHLLGGTVITADDDREETHGTKRIRYLPLLRWLLETPK
jgi:predicted AAA+ superfamily ATPase